MTPEQAEGLRVSQEYSARMRRTLALIGQAAASAVVIAPAFIAALFIPLLRPVVLLLLLWALWLHRDNVPIAWSEATKWARNAAARMRGYRFSGQQAIHRAQRDETAAAINNRVAQASAELTPERLIMLDQSRHSMEERLAVLVEKPRLTLEEKRERTMIERHLYGVPSTVSTAQPVREPLFRWRAISLGGPLHWYAIGALILSNAGLGVWGGFQHLRAERLESAANEARQEADEARAIAERNFDAAQEAAQQARISAEGIAAERRRARIEAQRARRRADVGQQIESGSAPDWGGILGLMQPPRDTTAAPPSPGADPSGVPSAASGGGGDGAADTDGAEAAGR